MKRIQWSLCVLALLCTVVVTAEEQPAFDPELAKKLGHMMAPTLDDFAKQHAGTALVLKLDTEAEPTIAARYGIRGIPTLIVFDQGKEKARHVGVADLKTLEKLVGVSAG